MTVHKIISGGQIGADQGGLAAGKALGLVTGGCMPKGFRTEDGSRPDMRDLYGMVEHLSPDYPPRTEANVVDSDATLIFGDAVSPGCRLTIKLCRKHRKLFHIIPWTTTARSDLLSVPESSKFQHWLDSAKVQILNVAGNRESRQPGIYEACRDFLIEALP